MGKETLVLFDVDGTLTPHRNLIRPETEAFIQGPLKENYTIGLVGGSDLEKIAEQMGGKDVIKKFDYVFAENGLVAYKNGELINVQSILKHLGEENCQKLINFSLKYMSELQLPCKRGNFVEFRSGLINLCPVGRSCSQEERNAFAAYDKEHGIRKKFREALMKEFPEMGIVFAIGGQISLDAFPTGWDKRFCLQFVEKDFKEIHFFGDRTEVGGNDHEIYSDERTVGHAVVNPEDTVKQLKETFGLWKELNSIPFFIIYYLFVC